MMVLEPDHWFRNAVTMDGNGRVPCTLVIDAQAWRAGFRGHRAQLEAARARCPDVSFYLPEEGAEVGRAGDVRITDAWGCDWLYNTTSGDGQAVSHPLRDSWTAPGWTMPDPATYLDWAALEKQAHQTRLAGEPVSVGTEHGFFFLRLTYLRGFGNLMIDIAEQSPEFLRFLEEFTCFWVSVADRLAALEPDVANWADDLGMQHSLPMSPSHWRKLIGTGYARVMAACKGRGARTTLHTDGYIVDIIPDLIACGVDVLNPQDLVNGLGNLSRLAKGKVAINLDIDRQSITPFGTASEIREHIGECVRTLGSPTGGLSLIYGAYSGVPVANVVAVLESMQEFQDYWVRRRG